MAMYTWPEAVYQLSDLEYTCLACNVKASDVQTLKDHVNGQLHKKTLQNESISEDHSVSGKFEFYSRQEQPLRDEAKLQKGLKSKAFIEKIKDFQASLSPEEKKAHVAERKRKRNEEMEASGGKKVKLDPYTCGICKIDINGSVDIECHLSGFQHKKLAQEFVGGCMLCGVAAAEVADHLASARHNKRMVRLQTFGVNASQFVSGTGNNKGGLKGGRLATGKAQNNGAPQKLIIKSLNFNASSAVPNAASTERIDTLFCSACKEEMNTVGELFAHMQGMQHAHEAHKFAGGCAICGIMSTDGRTHSEHWSSKKHTLKMSKLQAWGLSL